MKNINISADSFNNICTPFALIRKNILYKNIQSYASNFSKRKIALRPHIKTHKCSEIAQLQTEFGANGITTATIGEAEFFNQSGIKNIFLAYPLVGQPAINRAQKLLETTDLLFSADNIFHLEQLLSLKTAFKGRIAVRIEINSGHNRCGLKPEELGNSGIIQLLKKESDFFDFRGVFTHGGHAYSTTDPGEIHLIAQQECQKVIEAAEILNAAGLFCYDLSVGTTPTARFIEDQRINEIRPGNYVFNDGIQLANGTATIDECALRIVSRVIGIYKDHFVIDAGSKALGLDRGAHGMNAVEGFGTIIDYPELIIRRLSEEHGIVDFSSNSRISPKIGEIIEIIPNHSCAAANLFSTYHVKNENNQFETWAINARR